MTPESSEPAPPLEPADLALEASLHAYRPRPPHPIFLDHLIAHLEQTAHDEAAASAPDLPPMPLDASLLAFEKELRLLRPLDMDFPTGQRVFQALDREIAAVSAPAEPVFTALPTLSAVSSHVQPQRKRWSVASPWAAAAALIAFGWVALPYLPQVGNELATATAAPPSGLIPFARSGERGTVEQVFSSSPRQEVFRADPSLMAGGLMNSYPANRRPIILPEATVPLHGLLDVKADVLPADDCRRIGITHGVAIRSVGYGGPAWVHGLQEGDIILRINGAPVNTVDELSIMVKNSAPGSIAVLRILRQHEFMELPVRLGVAPSA